MLKNSTYAEQIKKQILTSIEDISHRIDNTQWTNKLTYAQWLAQTYFYTRQATRVIALAAAKTSNTNEEFHLKLLQLIQEEKSHEVLAENDLKNLGFSIEDFTELPSTTTYYATLYYLIENMSPFSIFGYFSILEGLAVSRGDQMTEIVQSAFSNQCVSFLKVHSSMDVKHFEQDLKALDHMTESELKITELSVTLSYKNYVTLLEDIRHSQRHKDQSPVNQMAI